MAELKEKCPHYDPITREQVKPGKSCPQYNTAKGCPYAHPWEPAWDGDNTPYKGVSLSRATAARGVTPVSKRVPRRGNSKSSSASEGMAVAIIPRNNEDAMEVDSQEPINSEPELNIIPNTEEEYESSVAEPVLPGGVNPVEHNAVATFIRQLVFSLYHANAYEEYTDEFRKYKAMAKATVDHDFKTLKADQRPDIRGLCSPSVHEMWLDGKTAREQRSKERLHLMDGWIDGLIALDGEEDSRRMDEDDTMDGADQEHRQKKREDPLVLALKDRRWRLHRGVAGQRLVDLLISLEESRRILEERQMQIGAPPLGLSQMQITPTPLSRQEDLEMRDASPPPLAILPSLPPPEESAGRRFRALKEKVEELSQRVQEVEELTTNEDTNELVRQIVDRVLDDYLSRLRSAEQSNSELIGGLMDLAKRVQNERTSCLALERLLGRVPIFDKAIESQLTVMESLSEQLASNDLALNTMIEQIEKAQEDEASVTPQNEQDTLVKQMRIGIVEQLLGSSAITSGSAQVQLPQQQQQQPPAGNVIAKFTSATAKFTSVSYDVPEVDLSEGHAAIRFRQDQWLQEYEALKAQALESVRPVVERTKRQIEGLEAEGKERSVESRRENDIMIH